MQKHNGQAGVYNIVQVAHVGGFGFYFFFLVFFRLLFYNVTYAGRLRDELRDPSCVQNARKTRTERLTSCGLTTTAEYRMV